MNIKLKRRDNMYRGQINSWVVSANIWGALREAFGPLDVCIWGENKLEVVCQVEPLHAVGAIVFNLDIPEVKSDIYLDFNLIKLGKHEEKLLRILLVNEEGYVLRSLETK